MFIYAQWYEYSFTNLYNDIDYGEFIAIIKSNRIESFLGWKAKLNANVRSV